MPLRRWYMYANRVVIPQLHQFFPSFRVTTRFAYIYHRRKGIRVYLRGKESDGPQFNLLAGYSDQVRVEQRVAMGSPWAQSTPYFLNIDSENHVHAAIPLLLYAASHVKARPSSYFLQPSEENASELLEGKRFTVQVSRVILE